MIHKMIRQRTCTITTRRTLQGSITLELQASVSLELAYPTPRWLLPHTTIAASHQLGVTARLPQLPLRPDSTPRSRSPRHFSRVINHKRVSIGSVMPLHLLLQRLATTRSAMAVPRASTDDRLAPPSRLEDPTAVQLAQLPSCSTVQVVGCRTTANAMR